MRNDLKIKALRTRFGSEGYAVWCYMLEVLTDSEHFEIEWDDLHTELLSGDFGLSTERLIEIITYCVEVVGLLQLSGGKLCSENLSKRFGPLLAKRGRRRAGVKPKPAGETGAAEEPVKDAEDGHARDAKTEKDGVQDWKGRCGAGTCGVSEGIRSVITGESGVPDIRNRHSKGEESKEKESKVDQSKEEYKKEQYNEVYISDPDGITAKEIERFYEILFLRKCLFAPEEYERFVNHYSKTGWLDGNGNKIVNPQAALRNWTPAPGTVPVPGGFHRKWSEMYLRLRKECPQENYIALLSGLYGVACGFLQTNITVNQELYDFMERSAATPVIRTVYREVFGSVKLTYRAMAGIDLNTEKI